MNNRVSIRCTSKVQHSAVLGALYALGYKYHGTVEDPFTAVEEYPYERYPILTVYRNRKEICGNIVVHEAELITLEQFLEQEIIAAQDIHVALNDKYTAVVHSDNTVIVGCQEFSFEAVDRLAAAVAEQRNKKAII